MPARISEHDIESKVVAYARSKGVLVVKQTHQGARSHPDRAFYFAGGRLLQIEFKAPSKLPTTLQAVTIKKLIALEFTVLLVDDIADGIAVIDHHLACGSNDVWQDMAIISRINKTLRLCDKILNRKSMPMIDTEHIYGT